MPIDILASTLVDLALADHASTLSPGIKVYHPLNPKPTNWQTLLPHVVEILSGLSNKVIKAVPYATWVKAVRAESEKNVNRAELAKLVDEVPAIKLLPFFEMFTDTSKDFPELEVRNAPQVSRHLRELEGIEPQWMELWIRGWLANLESTVLRQGI